MYLNNKWFSDDPSVIRDNQNACYIALRERLRQHDIDLATEDINKVEKSDIVIQLDVNSRRHQKNRSQKAYLLLIEPPIVNKNNWDRGYHSAYDRIFTWNDSLADNKRYFLLRMAYDFRFNGSANNLHEKKLCSMIVGYKFSRGSSELYSERLAAINWFSRKHPEDFEYYGEGWPGYLFPYFGRSVAGFYPFLEAKIPGIILKALLPANKAYKGRTFSKLATLKKYRFSICYENMEGIPGYITEKIFDSFSAGCVPVYLGATNIGNLIPSGCFVNRRDFGSYDELYKFMAGMDELTYKNYLSNIEYFTRSDAAKVFSAEYYASSLTEYIIKDIC